MSNETALPSGESQVKKMNNVLPQNSGKVPPGWLLLGIAILIVPILFAGLLLFFYRSSFAGPLSSGHDHWGQFGDLFGGILNPVLAWLGLLVTVVSLHYAVEAIRVSTEAIKQSTHQFEKQKQSEEESSRKQLAVEMHKLWISPEMQTIRTELWAFLKSLEIITAQASPVFLGRFRYSDVISERRLYYSLGTITHFLGDLTSMLNAKLVDEATLVALLGRSLDQWVKMYARLDFRCYENDNDPLSETEQMWHKLYVEEFAELLHQHAITNQMREIVHGAE
jgi:hypothetical protein